MATAPGADLRFRSLLTGFSGDEFTRCLVASSAMAGTNPFPVPAMLIAAIISRLRGAARSFAAANQGNIAVIFAIALLPVLGFVGAAIDYSRAVSARSSMQAALDSTALMLSRDLAQGLITPSQINASAEAYFTALYTNTYTRSVAVTATYTA